MLLSRNAKIVSDPPMVTLGISARARSCTAMLRSLRNAASNVPKKTGKITAMKT